MDFQSTGKMPVKRIMCILTVFFFSKKKIGCTMDITQGHLFELLEKSLMLEVPLWLGPFKLIGYKFDQHL